MIISYVLVALVNRPQAMSAEGNKRTGASPATRVMGLLPQGPA
jgi:hypothetical protein